MLSTLILPLVLSLAGMENTDIEPYTDLHRISTEMLLEYNLEPPEIRIENFIEMPEAMAKNICYIDRDTNDVRCEIVFRPCVLELRDSIRENVFAHEVAHYINAQVYRNFDHGRRWRQIVRQFGYRPVEVYRETITPQCDV